MARIPILTEEERHPDLQQAFERHMAEYNARITNMKATLGHSLLAFNIYMQWYPLYRQVERITGQRIAYLFAYAISTASDCPLCSTFFRKIIIDSGEQPDQLVLSGPAQELLSFGAVIAKNRGTIDDQLYKRVAIHYTHAEMVTLIAFAGQMIATNIFNNVIETEIDDYLSAYLPNKNNLV
jgi:hypothetical protein